MEVENSGKGCLFYIPAQHKHPTSMLWDCVNAFALLRAFYGQSVEPGIEEEFTLRVQPLTSANDLSLCITPLVQRKGEKRWHTPLFL